ncbi:CehA/McbA family metallohydrolase [Paenibacillus solisilvae]|uniref:CehA/McbA family metallohydrolase n=1 Tax=Paenibacillus solisilvae TaxID=2486751 RepID=A0ABW0W6H8_9BACL
MFSRLRTKIAVPLSLLLTLCLVLQFVPLSLVNAASSAGMSSDSLPFSYGPSAQDMLTGTPYYYVENEKAKVVISTVAAGNNRAGSFQVKYTPVDFVLKDSIKRDTLDWTQFILSDTPVDGWNYTGKSIDLTNVEVRDGDKVVASGVSQENSNLAATVSYTLLPNAPIMKMTVHLENTGAADYNGFLNYQMDHDEGEQIAYAPGLGWDPKALVTSGWTGNYLYDGDRSESSTPAHGIAWYENEPVALNAQGYIAGVWFDASVKAGNSRDISIYHITDRPLGENAYTSIENWASLIPGIQSGNVTMASVNGTVYNEDGVGVPGVKVTARNIEAQAVNAAITDDQGNYSMYLPIGTYTLTGNRMAYSDSSNSIEIDSVSSPYQLNLYMESITVSTGTGKMIPGGLSEGGVNDIVMENQKMAVTIAKAYDDPQLAGYTAGKPVDMAAQGANDGLDWINFPYVSDTQPGGAQAWQILKLKNQAVDIVENSGSIAMVKASGTTETAVPFQVDTTYTMKPDQAWVYVDSAIKNPTDQPQTVWVGDAMDDDDRPEVAYVPGTGVISAGSTTLGTFTPTMPWLAMYGTEPQAHALIYEGDFEGFTAFGNTTWMGSQKQVTIPAGGTFHLKRYLASPSTTGFENKIDAVFGLYEDILKGKTGLNTDFQLTPQGIIKIGDNATAEVTVTNDSDKTVEGLKVKLGLSANLSGTEALEKTLDAIAPKSTVKVQWPLTAVSGGRGSASMDVELAGNLIASKTDRIFVEGPGWYAGDNHSHSRWSDGSGTINDNFTSGRNKGMDFLTATDHNTVNQQNDVVKENRDDFVALWGEEISTTAGHSLAYNISDYIDYKQTAQEYIDDTRASNNGQGMHFIAHPFYPGLEWENWDATNYNGLEVWNGFYPPKHPVNAQAVAKWDELNNQGRHLYGISNSDAHNPGKVASNYIRAYLPKLSKENIYEALRNGTFYGTNGPSLTFTVDDVMMGKDVAVSASGGTVTVDLSGYAEKGLTSIRLIKNGEVAQQWTPNGNEFNVEYAAEAVPGDFFRIEVEGNNGQYAFSNPVFVVEKDSVKPVWENGQLSVSDETENGVTLNWSGAMDNKAVTQYKILQNGSELKTVKVGDLTQTNNMYKYPVTGLSQSAGYTFKVEAGDAAGNWSTDGPSAKVKLDKTAPVTTDDAPANWVNKDVTVTLQATDNGSGVDATYYKVDGGAQQKGSSVMIKEEGQHTLTYWSVDKAGNVEAPHTVTVNIDKTAPTLKVVLDKTMLWPPNHKLVAITASVNAVDNTVPVDSVALTSITSNEPDSGLGDGDLPNDIQGTAYGTFDKAFMLRAERSKKRVYTVTYTATDKAGNKTSASATVTVPHDQSGQNG